MKLYVAGVFVASFNLAGNLYQRLTEGEKRQRESASNYLESYHYIHRQRYVDMIREEGRRIFLDSGAFSAFSLGAQIDLPGYCEYIKRNEDIIEKVDGDLIASVLDGIGDPLKTYQNQLAMESLGVRPLPCFHYGEDERYLEWYVANYTYITLGGMVMVSTQQLQIWLDRIWEKYLTDGAGRPKIKVHGFGLTTTSLMRRYPWYSVDSSSWVQLAKTGNMLMLPSGKPLNVSDRSPNRKMDGQHIDTLPALQREAVEEYFRARGVDTDRMRSIYLSRWSHNLWAYEELGKLITAEKNGDPRFVIEQQGLF